METTTLDTTMQLGRRAERTGNTTAMSPAATQPSTRRLAFRPDIEGLRGIAITLVVAYHVGVPYVRGGFVGVDVFFVLSGFLITGLLVNEATSTGSISPAAFYARRARRLLPAACLVILATLASTAILRPPQQVVPIAETARAAAVYLSNSFFSNRATDYFGENSATNPLLHTWSLAVEEQFYLVWPWLVLILVRRGRSMRALAWGLVAVLVLSLVASWWYSIARRPTAFYSTPTRAWEFAVGGVAALGVGSLDAATARVRGLNELRVASGWLGLGLVLGSAVGYSETTTFPGVAATVPVIGTALLLAPGGVASRLGVGHILSSRPFQHVGRLSYSWYLWHWPVLVLGGVALTTGGLETRIALAVGALALSALTFYVVEDPCRRWSVLRRRTRLTLGLGAMLTFATIVGAETVRRMANGFMSAPSQQVFAAAARDLPVLYFDGCAVRPAEEDRVRVCDYGNRDSPVRVLLFGDSHTAHWLPPLRVVAQENRWQLSVVIKTACATAEVPVYSRSLARRLTECLRWRQAALDTIRSRQPTLVVLSNAVGYTMPYPNALVTTKEWQAGLANMLRELRRTGSAVLVIRDTPLQSYNVPACLAWASWRSKPIGICSTSRSDAVDDTVGQAEQAAVREISGTYWLDLTNEFCGSKLCPPMIDGLVVYRDNNHITATFAAHLAPKIRSAITDAGLLQRLKQKRSVTPPPRIPKLAQ